MAANLEVNIVSKDVLSLEKFSLILEQENIFVSNLCIKKVRDYNFPESEIVDSVIFPFSNRDESYFIYFEIKDLNFCAHLCGIQIEEIGNGLYQYGFWIDTKNIAFADDNFITPQNRFLYDNIYRVIKSFFTDIRIAAIGVETIFDFDENVEKCIENSYNITAWFIPFEENIKTQNIFGSDWSKKLIENATVFEMIAKEVV